MYTIVTNDKYEFPVRFGLSTKEVADLFGVTTSTVRNMVFKPRKKSRYKVVLDGKEEYDRKAYQKQYDMTHDRTEYFKEYYRRNCLKGGINNE